MNSQSASKPFQKLISVIILLLGVILAVGFASVIPDFIHGKFRILTVIVGALSFLLFWAGLGMFLERKPKFWKICVGFGLIVGMAFLGFVIYSKIGINDMPDDYREIPPYSDT